MKEVKRKPKAAARKRNQTKVSTKNQVTIPVAALRSAGLVAGDTLKVETDGSGRLVLTRLEEWIDLYSGSLDSAGRLRSEVEGLRDEWQ